MRVITSSGTENISIGELSKHSAVNIETIRYYERIEMLAATAAHRRRPARLRHDGPPYPGLHPTLARAGLLA